MPYSVSAVGDSLLESVSIAARRPMMVIATESRFNWQTKIINSRHGDGVSLIIAFENTR